MDSNQMTKESWPFEEPVTDATAINAALIDSRPPPFFSSRNQKEMLDHF